MYQTSINGLLFIETDARSSRVSMRHDEDPFFEQLVSDGIDPFDAHQRVVRDFYNSSIQGDE